MQGVKIKDLKKGELFVLSPDFIDEYREVISYTKIYERGVYCRDLKRYSATKFSDICFERFFKGDKIVYIDFIF